MIQKKTVHRIGCAIVLAVVALVAAYFYYGVDYAIHGIHLASFTSPDGRKTAYLLCPGMMRDEFDLLVSENASPDSVQWIDIVADGDCRLLFELEWSADCSLLAARCTTGIYARDRPADIKRDDMLTHAFDFRTHTRYVPRYDGTNATYAAWMQRNDMLERLMEARGGVGQCVRSSDTYWGSRTRRLGWLEWRQWRARVTKAQDAVNRRDTSLPPKRQ